MSYSVLQKEEVFERVMTQTKGFHVVRRPEGMVSQFELVVVDGKGYPHLALTRCYQQFRQQLSDGTAYTYLSALLPYFTFLDTDHWRLHRQDQWDSKPENIREAVRDYLLQKLHCKVRRYGMYEIVALSAQSPSTVRVFLSALKRFYTGLMLAGEYPHEHPLTNPVVHLLENVDENDGEVPRSRPKMPPESGIEEPQRKRTSDNYFRLVDKEWIPEPIDDPALHLRLSNGFKQARVSRRDQIIIRMAYESGARITELLTLTVGDWRKRGTKQEAAACNKGSHGRRVKIVRFSMETAKLLHCYVNEDRVRVDPLHRTFAQLSDHEPLFLSARRKPYGYDAFIPHWERLCKTLGIDLNVHGLRHWYVCQMMRLIHEIATTPGEVERRKEEMVRYMAWRSPETLKAYEHYFQAIHHAQMQDVLHQQLDKKLKDYVEQARRKKHLPKEAHTPDPRSDASEQEVGWGSLLDFGGEVYE
jgi:integrase